MVTGTVLTFIFFFEMVVRTAPISALLRLIGIGKAPISTAWKLIGIGAGPIPVAIHFNIRRLVWQNLKEAKRPKIL